jgi:hypothetical protein
LSLPIAIWVDDIIALGAKADLDTLETDITSHFAQIFLQYPNTPF